MRSAEVSNTNNVLLASHASTKTAKLVVAATLAAATAQTDPDFPSQVGRDATITDCSPFRSQRPLRCSKRGTWASLRGSSQGVLHGPVRGKIAEISQAKHVLGRPRLVPFQSAMVTAMQQAFHLDHPWGNRRRVLHGPVRGRIAGMPQARRLFWRNLNLSFQSWLITPTQRALQLDPPKGSRQGALHRPDAARLQRCLKRNACLGANGPSPFAAAWGRHTGPFVARSRECLRQNARFGATDPRPFRAT